MHRNKNLQNIVLTFGGIIDDTKFMAVKMPLSIAVYENSKGEVFIGLMNGYLLTRMLSGTKEASIMEYVVRDIESILGFVHFRYSIF